ncbi:hypothetical protein GCM10010269_64700 [Streptomyces humidus]|uniref:Uncharacterized protein n=1 Tax=Streptomyces humidus TaxID=52259 RepID=A0A918L6Z2_9ACTN|nr:hypothetical protein [Streptomyces humidus]GGS16633.1 hypothetical protein GCM10010269_64700 [Streptomyces humidus]
MEFLTHALAAWLAQGTVDRDKALATWHSKPHGMLLLPAGIRWDAVKIPGEQGWLAYTRLQNRAASLGPILWDRWLDHMYFLVPTGSAALWPGPNPRLVTTGGWLAAPDPRRPVRRAVWLPCAPDGRLTRPDQLFRAADCVLPIGDPAGAAR